MPISGSPLQLPAATLGGSNDGSNDSVPETYVGDVGGVPGFRLASLLREFGE